MINMSYLNRHLYVIIVGLYDLVSYEVKRQFQVLD